MTSGKIADGTIVTADLADSAVTSAKIADGAVTYNDITTTLRPFVTAPQVLWSGAVYMFKAQEVALSKKVSEMAHGIVLVFSHYNTDNKTASNYCWSSFFVPKAVVAVSNGTGHIFFSMTWDRKAMCKYLYIYDTKITGLEGNEKAGTANGVAYDNSIYVLRYVIGV